MTDKLLKSLNISLQEMRYIVALGQECHFGKAASLCNITQPTLSIKIKDIEEKLGVTLFDRSQKKIALSAAGELILEQAKKTLLEANKISEILQHSKDPMAGTLHIGIIPTIGPYLVPRLIAPIKKAFPELRLNIREDLTHHLIDQLDSGQLDFILISPPLPNHHFELIDLYHEPFVLALPAIHPLCAKETIAISDIQKYTILLLEEGHCLRDQTLDICTSKNIRSSEEIMGTSLETLRQMIALNAGISLFPQLSVSTLTNPGLKNEIQYRPLSSDKIGRLVSIAYRQGYPRAETIKKLAQFIKKHLPSEVKIMN